MSNTVARTVAGTVASTVASTPPYPVKKETEDAPEGLPVAPEQGLVPAVIQDDPEQKRVVLPAD